MSSFGERLRQEREARNRSIQEIAVATGIQLDYLEALEKDEFHALPGRAFGKFYIRAYAEVLGIDSRSLIDAYEREQRLRHPSSMDLPDPEPVRPRRVEEAVARWREARIAARNRTECAVASVQAEAREEDLVEVPENEHEAPAEHDGAVSVASVTEENAHVPKAASWSGRRLVVALLFLGLFTGAVGTCFTLLKARIEGSGPPSLFAPEQGTTGKSVARVESAGAARSVPVADPPEAPRPTRAAAAAATEPDRLTVAEFGVGRRMVGRRLEDREEPFAPGEVAWFSTRVLGGRPGEPIRHVWVHEGKAVQSILLRLGSPDWRTHSSKTLRHAGEWAVEVRDEEGRVLARATFACVPTGPESAHRGSRLRPPSSR